MTQFVSVFFLVFSKVKLSKQGVVREGGVRGEAFRDTSFLAPASSVVCISLLLSRKMLTFF